MRSMIQLNTIPGFLVINTITRGGESRTFTVNADEVKIIGTDGHQVWVEMKSQSGKFVIDDITDSYESLCQKLKQCMEALKK